MESRESLIGTNDSLALYEESEISMNVSYYLDELSELKTLRLELNRKKKKLEEQLVYWQGLDKRQLKIF